MKTVFVTLIVCVTLLGGLWMWLGEGQYAGIAPLTRTNRLTGETQELRQPSITCYPSEWVKVQVPQ